MASWLERIAPRSAFTRAVMTLSGGTLLAQGLTILAAPLLTRLYSPADFGAYAVYIGVVAIFVAISSAGYKRAIPVPQSDGDAAHLVWISALAVLATVVLSLLVIAVGQRVLASMVGGQLTSVYVWLIPLGVLAGSLFEILNYWSVRNRTFGVLASARIQQSVAQVVSQVALSAQGALGITVGHIVGAVLGVVQLARRGKPVSGARGNPSMQDLRRVAADYRRFPKFSVGADLVGQAGWQAPPLLLALLFGPAVAGFFALTHRLLSLPSKLVGSAVGSVFLSDAPTAHREGRLAASVTGVMQHLAQIGLPFAAFVALCGPELFSLVFGESWRVAGVYARWMAIWLVMAFVVSPPSVICEVIGRNRVLLQFQSGALVVRVAAIVAGYALDSALTAVILLSLGNAAAYGWFGVWLFRATGSTASVFYQKIGNALVWAAMLTSPLVIAGMLTSPDFIAYWLLAAASLLLIVGRYAMLYRDTVSRPK